MHQSEVEASNQSVKGIYYGSLSEDIALPMLSLAPELTLRGVKAIFNEKTDVWTFGITLIELYQLGKLPYPGFESVNDVLKFVWTGHIHPQPKFCPDAVYDRVVKACLSQKRDRPMISAVLRELQQLMGVNVDVPDRNDPQISRNSISSRAQVTPISNIPEPLVTGYSDRSSNRDRLAFNRGDMYSPTGMPHFQSNQNNELDHLQPSESGIDTSGYALTHIPIAARSDPHNIHESSA